MSKKTLHHCHGRGRDGAGRIDPTAAPEGDASGGATSVSAAAMRRFAVVVTVTVAMSAWSATLSPLAASSPGPQQLTPVDRSNASPSSAEGGSHEQTNVVVPEPENYRTDDYRKPVPQTLKGAEVLSPQQAEALWQAKSAIFIDVYPHAPKPPNLPKGTLWRETTHQSIENAVWLANVGYGVLSEAADRYFRRNLETLTGGDKSKSLVFFCLRNCWMSWNAAKRAMAYGYSDVKWFPDGTDAWQEIGQLVVEVRPQP